LKSEKFCLSHFSPALPTLFDVSCFIQHFTNMGESSLKRCFMMLAVLDYLTVWVSVWKENWQVLETLRVEKDGRILELGLKRCLWDYAPKILVVWLLAPQHWMVRLLPCNLFYMDHLLDLVYTTHSISLVYLAHMTITLRLNFAGPHLSLFLLCIVRISK